jgi:uncharacterized lipoprotein YddW (UPF0748 family)
MKLVWVGGTVAGVVKYILITLRSWLKPERMKPISATLALSLLLLVLLAVSYPFPAHARGAGGQGPGSEGLEQPVGPAAEEIRGAWVTRWAFRSPEDIRTMFEGLRSAGVNTVFFQVRGACTVLYRSKIEPWSGVLAGKLGEDPGWDPLEVAVVEAHMRGMAIHAWMNVFPAWPVSDSPKGPRETEPRHVMLEHPEWLAVNRRGEAMPLERSETSHAYAFLSPTAPGVKEHIRNIVTEIITNYELDGLHLDYVRFPDSTYSYDETSTSAYRSYVLYAPQGMTYALWRSSQLTGLIGDIKKIVSEARPHAIVSVTMRRDYMEGKEHFFQDGLDWLLQGYVDLLVPMIYTTNMEAFEKSVREYTLLAGEESVVAGIGAYLDTFDDITFAGQMQIARSYGLRGISVFNSDYAVKYADLLKTISGGD